MQQLRRAESSDEARLSAPLTELGRLERGCDNLAAREGIQIAISSPSSHASTQWTPIAEPDGEDRPEWEPGLQRLRLPEDEPGTPKRPTSQRRWAGSREV